MIVVRVLLHKYGTGEVVELARMHISNTGGGSVSSGDYHIDTLQGRRTKALDRGMVQRRGDVRNHPRLRLHVWTLVAKALRAVGYVEDKP